MVVLSNDTVHVLMNLEHVAASSFAGLSSPTLYKNTRRDLDGVWLPHCKLTVIVSSLATPGTLKILKNAGFLAS